MLVLFKLLHDVWRTLLEAVWRTWSAVFVVFDIRLARLWLLNSSSGVAFFGSYDCGIN